MKNIFKNYGNKLKKKHDSSNLSLTNYVSRTDPPTMVPGDSNIADAAVDGDGLKGSILWSMKREGDLFYHKPKKSYGEQWKRRRF